MSTCLSLRLTLALAWLVQLPIPAAQAGETIYVFTGDDGSVSLSNVPTSRRFKPLVGDGLRSVPAAAGGQRRSLSEPKARYQAVVDQAAQDYGLDSALLHAVVSVESGYDPAARSPKGAAGLMQLMPATAKRYGVADVLDPWQNLQGGARYLRDLLKMFNSDLNLALAAYNAGEKAVTGHGNRIPPYRETADYVPRVLAYYRKYQGGGQEPD